MKENIPIKAVIDEKQVISMAESKKSMYIDMLKKRILETQESLKLMYELCSNVFEVEL